jgi:multiple sugar transport system substrate-binding protein
MKAYRVLAAVIFLALAGLFVAGCDPGYDTKVYGRLESVKPSQDPIIFWYQHSGEREKVIKALIDDFNKSNPWGITVTGEFAGSYAEIYDKIMKCIPNGSCPEIAVAYQNQAAMYAKMNGVVESTPYRDSPRWGFTKAELADFFPFVWKGDLLPQFKGRYGFPPYRSMEVLYYNEDWLKELGYKDPPSTWEEFAEAACAASDSAAGTTGYEMAIDASTFADMVFNRGGSMLEEDAKAYAFGNQAGLDVLKGLQDLFRRGCARLETGSDDDQKDFGDRRVLFIISSTSSLPVVRDAVKGAFNWSVSTLPTTLPKPRVNVYGASLSVFRSTPEKQLAAWLFIKWLTEPEQSARWTRATGYFPVRQTTMNQLAKDFAANPNPQFETAWGFLGNEIAIEPGVVGYDECRDLITEMLTAVVHGEDPATQLAQTVDKCNVYLKTGIATPRPGN